MEAGGFAKGLAPARILVINPNTNAQVTARVRAAAACLAAREYEFTVTNPAQGPHSIESPADRAAAEPRVLEILHATLDDPYDVCVMACFDDIAIAGARALTGRPVVGTVEAGVAAARRAAFGRFAIVTTVDSAVPVIQSLLARHAPDVDCVVRAAGIGVAEAAGAESATRARLASTVERALREDDARCILLASGGLTGWADALSAQFEVPVIDGVMAALQAAMRVSRPGA